MSNYNEMPIEFSKFLVGNAYNHTLNNLKWMTPKENMWHVYQIGIARGNRSADSEKHFESAAKCTIC